MRFYEAAAVVAESRALSAEEFIKLHPNPVLLIEPFTSTSGAPGTATTTRVKVGPEDERTALHPKARVCWLTPEFHGSSRETRWPPLRLGRDGTCEISLPHPSISKHHATLRHAEDAWTITDEGSTNGTALNETALEPHVSAPIREGDLLVLGKIVVFRPIFKPGELYRLVRQTDPTPARPASSRLARVDLELLASTFRSLGLETEMRDGQLHVRSLGGDTDVRVSVEKTVYAVEWGHKGVFVKRKTLALTDPRAEEQVRLFVLEGMSFGAGAAE